jgi:predicted MFS family arabinose efflux permease
MYTRWAKPSADCSPKVLQHYTSKSVESICGHSTLLVELAAEFQTSVAVTGQLAAAIGLFWGITAPLVGAVSDTDGRRRVGLTGLLLMALGTLGAVFAWSDGALLAC